MLLFKASQYQSHTVCYGDRTTKKTS